MQKRNLKGQLTIFFGLILTTILLFAFTLIRGAGYSANRVAISCAHDAAGNSVLANYHRELFDRYGLLFFYVENVDKRMEEVINQNFENDVAGKVLGTRDLLALEVKETALEKITLATDNDGKVIWRQCVQCMEEKYGIPYLEQFLETLKYVEDKKLMSDEVILPYEEGTITETELRNKLAEADLRRTVIPDVFHWLEKEALKFLIGKREYSLQRLGKDKRLSGRQWNSGDGMHESSEVEINEWKKFLYIEYLLQYTGNYVSPLEDGFLKYQTEYLINGKEEDGNNLWETANSLIELRTGANIIGILTNDQRTAVLKEASVAVASSLGNPEIEPVVYAALLLIWAEVEGVHDVRALLRGEGVGLLKTADEWLLDVTWISGIAKVTNESETDSEIKENPVLKLLLQEESSVIEKNEGEQIECEQAKLMYEDYLRILLWLQPEDKLMIRFMDIVESDIRSITGQNTFRLDEYGEKVGIRTKFNGKYGSGFLIYREYAY